MRDYSLKPCPGSKAGECPNGGKKGPNQLKQMRCYKCTRLQKATTKKETHDKRVVGVYGLEPGEYWKIYEEQGGTCAMPFCN